MMIQEFESIINRQCVIGCQHTPFAYHSLGIRMNNSKERSMNKASNPLSSVDAKLKSVPISPLANLPLLATPRIHYSQPYPQ